MSRPRGRAAPTRRVRVVRVADAARANGVDVVAGEEPMQIRLRAGDRVAPLATTMRTPGHDFELAAGFLLSEGLIRTRDDVRRIRYCLDVRPEERYNVVDVELTDPTLPDLHRLERYVTTSSACGVCGKAHLDAIALPAHDPPPDAASDPDPLPPFDPEQLLAMTASLRRKQRLFGTTGGLHAAGLFGRDGTAQVVREDVGRHNALDKAVGALALEGRDARDAVVCVSGRASYELLQKTVTAGARTFVAISAPSSLAIDVARRFDVTLVGFARPGRMNVYAGAHRIAHDA